MINEAPIADILLFDEADIVTSSEDTYPGIENPFNCYAVIRIQEKSYVIHIALLSWRI